MTILDDSHRTDPGLVADVHMGRLEAFSELYRRYYHGALRYALGMTHGDEARAQDAVSEAFAKVFRAVSRSGDVSAFWPYLLTAVRNAYRAELRRSVRVDLVERADDLDAFAPEPPNGSDLDDPSVRAAFRRLPARWQTVLWRSEVRGDTAAEIGQDLGISANAAAALALRAREGLRVEYLQDHLTDASLACRPYAEHLAKLVRGTLGRRERRRVEAHVRICRDCEHALADLSALSGRMRSVLPLILGVGPIASGHGLSSGPAVGSTLVGSAGAVASVATGTAGAGSAAAGLAGLAGVGGLGAVGLTHASAVAGLAVASVVALLGLPLDESSGEPAPQTPVVTNLPGAELDHPAVAPVQPGESAQDLVEDLAEPDGELAPGVESGTGLFDPAPAAGVDTGTGGDAAAPADDAAPLAGLATAEPASPTEASAVTGGSHAGGKNGLPTVPGHVTPMQGAVKGSGDELDDRWPGRGNGRATGSGSEPNYGNPADPPAEPNQEPRGDKPTYPARPAQPTQAPPPQPSHPARPTEGGRADTAGRPTDPGRSGDVKPSEPLQSGAAGPGR